MRIALALAIFLAIVMPRVQAAPLNNSTTEQRKVATPTEVVQQTITSEVPTPAAQPVIEPEQPQPVEIPVVETPPTQGCGDNEYANYIYMHESNCSTRAINSIGCRGIGQSCPGDKLPCGDDYVCQNEWFTNYALTRYGSWEAAYNFWRQNFWW